MLKENQKFTQQEKSDNLGRLVQTRCCQKMRLLLLIAIGTGVLCCNAHESFTRETTVVRLDFRSNFDQVDTSSFLDEDLINVTISNSPFVCAVPTDRHQSEESAKVDRQATPSQILQKDINHLKAARLSWLYDHCYIYKPNSEDFWSYELCIGGEISQFHHNKRYSQHRGYLHSLGILNSTLDEVHANGTVVQYYTEGTDGRNATLIMRCGMQLPTVVSVSEPSLRSYLIIFEAPSFCDWREDALGSKDGNSDVLLRGLEGHCYNSSAATGDWWTYEFCHPDSLVQFHRETTGDVSGQLFLLGTLLPRSYLSPIDPDNPSPLADFPRLRSPFIRPTKPSDPVKFVNLPTEIIPAPLSMWGKASIERDHMVLAMNLQHGTKCEETGEPRETRMIFECPENFADNFSTKILRISERKLCKYDLHIQTPYVCAHPLLMPLRQPEPQTVTCFPRTKPEASSAPPPVSFQSLPDREELERAIRARKRGQFLDRMLQWEDDVWEVSQSASLNSSDQGLPLGLLHLAETQKNESTVVASKRVFPVARRARRARLANSQTVSEDVSDVTSHSTAVATTLTAAPAASTVPTAIHSTFAKHEAAVGIESQLSDNSANDEVLLFEPEVVSESIEILVVDDDQRVVVDDTEQRVASSYTPQLALSSDNGSVSQILDSGLKNLVADGHTITGESDLELEALLAGGEHIWPKYGKGRVEALPSKFNLEDTSPVFGLGSYQRERSADGPRFVIGDVLIHTMWHYVGVVVGWDASCFAPQDFKDKIVSEYGGDNSILRGAFYLLLVDHNGTHPENYEYTYVSEQKLSQNPKGWKTLSFRHPYLHNYFDRFDVNQRRFILPEDHHLRKAFKCDLLEATAELRKVAFDEDTKMGRLEISDEGESPEKRKSVRDEL